MSKAVVLLNIEKVFDTIWHTVLWYKLTKVHFSTSLVKLISPFLSNRKFKALVEGEMSTLREIQAGVPQGPIPSPTLYNLFINDVSHHRVFI
jgi:retron-type reverse transcriptase